MPVSGLRFSQGPSALRQEAPEALARFVQSDGTVVFDAPAHILCATKA
jgi:hypothetical protein